MGIDVDIEVDIDMIPCRTPPFRGVWTHENPGRRASRPASPWMATPAGASELDLGPLSLSIWVYASISLYIYEFRVYLYMLAPVYIYTNEVIIQSSSKWLMKQRLELVSHMLRSEMPATGLRLRPKMPGARIGPAEKGQVVQAPGQASEKPRLFLTTPSPT